MFLPFVILVLVPIMGAFSYFAQFAIHIDPFVSSLDKQNQIDTLRYQCIHSISREFMRNQMYYNFPLSSAVGGTNELFNYAEISDQLVNTDLVSGRKEIEIDEVSNQAQSNFRNPNPLSIYSDDVTMICNTKYIGQYHRGSWNFAIESNSQTGETVTVVNYDTEMLYTAQIHRTAKRQNIDLQKHESHNNRIFLFSFNITRINSMNNLSSVSYVNHLNDNDDLINLNLSNNRGSVLFFVNASGNLEYLFINN